MQRRFGGLCWGQEQQFLLNFRSEHVQIQDLRHPGLGDVRDPGELGQVGYLASTNHPFKTDRQRHESGYTRNPAFGFDRLDTGLVLNTPAAMGRSTHLDFSCNGNHAASSEMPAASDLMADG